MLYWQRYCITGTIIILCMLHITHIPYCALYCSQLPLLAIQLSTLTSAWISSTLGNARIQLPVPVTHWHFQWHPLPHQVRVAERSVEGRHSRVHGILKRAPRAGVAYLSLEMRFPLLQELAATKPQCLQSLLSSWTKLETHVGMVRAVMWLGLCVRCEVGKGTEWTRTRTRDFVHHWHCHWFSFGRLGFCGLV